MVPFLSWSKPWNARLQAAALQQSRDNHVMHHSQLPRIYMCHTLQCCSCFGAAFYLISSSEAHDIAVRNSVRVILPSSEISAARNKRCKQNITAMSINSGLHRLTFICRRRIASCTAKVTCSSTNDWCHSTRRYNALVYYMYIWSDWMRAPPRSDVTSPRCHT